MSKKSKTDLVWVSRTVTEIQYFLVEVTKGAAKDRVVEACIEGDALYGTPHDTDTKQSDVEIDRVPNEKEIQLYKGEAIDLVEETK